MVFRLRWFTPTVEVDLCGHATLATCHVLWSEGYLPPDQEAPVPNPQRIAHSPLPWETGLS